jgi:Tol biopolymer transport system component
LRPPAEPFSREYAQLTTFADSATAPTLSPDGRMLAFIRGDTASFAQPGQVYVKLLPDGEPVQLTHDNLNKSDPKFAPDAARIGYTIFAADTAPAADSGPTLDTWIVPVLGGQPRLFLTNASGLTWIHDWKAVPASPPLVLFSEFTGRGSQMSIVSSTESRTGHRSVYMPQETGMAHRSYLSPDRKQVLVVEMINGWLPCRVLPFDGSSLGRPVGPSPAQCTYAAWSPDGKWMYFSTNTGNGSHVWRQRFPDGTPEQVTFGVTEEEGVEFAPDGRSFVTSIGTSQSTVWVHDSRGDRQITSEGYAFLPSVSPDGKKLYYLVRAGGAWNFVTGGLWVADLESGQRRRLLPDFQMRHYTISADGQRVAFVASDDAGHTPVWLAALNGRSAPRRLAAIDSLVAYFGAGSDVIFDAQERGATFIYRVKDDGSELQKMLPTPNLALFGVSPDGRWLSAETPTQFGATMVYSVGGGAPTLICGGCSPPQGPDMVPARLSWTPDGKFLYLKFGASTYAMPLPPGQALPPIPASGFQSREAVAAAPGAQLISDERVWPGPNPSIYAFAKVSTQRNIYRVPVP